MIFKLRISKKKETTKDKSKAKKISSKNAWVPKDQRGGGLQFFVALLSLTFGFAATYLILQNVAELPFDNYIRRILLPGGKWYLQWVQPIILYLCIYCVFNAVVKIFTSYFYKRQLKHKVLKKIQTAIALKGAKYCIRILKKTSKWRQGGKALTRVRNLLEMLNSTHDPQRAHEYLRHQFDIDTDSARSSYSTSRLFIWAMPIIGFIGTVLGIGLAVGDFASFLSGDIQKIEIVKAQLAKVSLGLSFAFDTTLVGLLGALVGMIFTSMAQGRDEGFLTDFEQKCLSIVISFRGDSLHLTTQTADPHRVDNFMSQVTSSIYLLDDRLKNTTVTLSNCLEGLSLSLTDNLQRLPADMADSLSQFFTTITNLQNSFETRIDFAVTSLHDFPERFAEKLTNMGLDSTSLDGHLSVLKEVGKNIRDECQALHSVLQKQNSLEHNFATISNVLYTFRDLLEEYSRIQQSLLPLLDKLSGPLEFKIVPSLEPGKEKSN